MKGSTRRQPATHLAWFAQPHTRAPPLRHASHSFLPSNFRHSFTLFSKFFSSFPHGTCSLSVSRSCLALEEIYLPLGVALPNNPTLGTRIVRGELRVTHGIFTLSDGPFSRHFYPGHTLIPRLQTTIQSDSRHSDFHLELFPLHSQLLGESWLVSFPPLINMLKFGGCSCFI